MQPFEAHSYIGSHIAQLREDGKRPPRSAKLVAYLDMGSGPGGGDYRRYLLGTNRERSLWNLWLIGVNEMLHCDEVTTDPPSRGNPPNLPPKKLPFKSWKIKGIQGDWNPGGPWEIMAGWSNQEDIAGSSWPCLANKF